MDPYKNTYDSFIYPPPPNVEEELFEFNDSIIAGNLDYESPQSTENSEFETCIDEASVPTENIQTNRTEDFSKDSLDSEYESEHRESGSRRRIS